MRIIGLLTFCMLGLVSHQAHSQCCSSGNPFISDAEQPALQDRVLTASIAYRYSHASQYYHLDSPFQILDFNETAYSNYSDLQIGYGCTRWLTVLADLGYFFNKSLATSGQEPYVGHGLGDLELYLKFNAYSNAKLRLSISTSVGVKFPIGVFDQEVDNVQLPITVQPSSGSYKYVFNVFVSKGMGRKFATAAFVSYEYSQLIDSENFYYKYGDLWIAALYFNYHIWKGLRIDLQIRNEYRVRSSRENGEIVESTGYDVVFFTPQVTYAFRHEWYVSAYGDIPLYKYYNGIQMSFGYSVSLRVTKKIDFLALMAGKRAAGSKGSAIK